MSDGHSNSECEKILSAINTENEFFDGKEYFEQLDRTIKLNGKVIVYLSIIYGIIIFLALIYLLMS
ncbi:MAG: hypothetical protein ROY99_07200 [Ignavibacterium sp.]|jgi:hypothetical protein|nr:hypothetical protein [Ignavibacterium sp.]